MILSKRIALNGNQLDEIDDAIVIRSIDPGITKESISTTSKMGGSGQRMTSQRWETLEVVVRFAILIQKWEMARRREVFDQVIAWAMQKGWLTVNWMPERRLYIDYVQIPGSGDMWEWTDEIQLVFRAYNIPFWLDETPAQAVSGTQASGTLTIQVGGNVESVIDATFANKSGMTIQNFRIAAGGNEIKLAGLNLGGSATLKIDHRTDGLLRIRIGSTSVYEKYTGADDLIVKPGSVNVTFTADRAGILTVQNYGRHV